MPGNGGRCRLMRGKVPGGSRFVNDVRVHLQALIWVGERAGPAVAPPFYASVYGFMPLPGASAER